MLRRFANVFPTCDGLPLGAGEIHQGQLGRAVDARLTPPRHWGDDVVITLW